MNARDVMRPVRVLLKEEDEAWSAARLLFDGGQAGAPVLDARDQLVGVLSQADLAPFLREKLRSAPDFYEEPDRDPAPSHPPVRVRQLMSRVIVQVEEDMPLEEVERHMLRRRVHRVLVLRGGEILGVVSSLDLIRAR